MAVPGNQLPRGDETRKIQSAHHPTLIYNSLRNRGIRLALLTVVVAAPSLFAQATPPASTAPLPTTSSASRPVVAARTVAPELRHPIEQLKTAIESRFPTKMEEVYSHYEQDGPTKKYLEGLLDRADTVYVKSIVFQNSHVTRNVAQVKYRMIIGFTAKGSMIPSEVLSTWRAALVRAGSKQPWQIQRLTRHAVM